MGDPALSELSTELENAGLIGGAAASILGLIAFADSAPGFLTSTADGAVWTKSVTNAARHSADLGIATLTFEGGSLNTTAAFAFDDDGLTDFRLLIEVAGGGAATMLTLEFDTAHAYLAEAKKQGTTIVGYIDPPQQDPPQRKALTLPLPAAAAVELSITRSGDDVLSAVTLHGSPAGPAAMAQGIYRFGLGDDVLVLPKLGNVGISVTDLFIDLSPTAATPVTGLFPEVYAPSWTGIGAKSIGVHLPLDRETDEWVNATLEGFLLGFDGTASLKGTLAYSTSDDKLIRSAAGEIDIRSNEVVRGALELGLNLERAAARLSETADGSPTQGLTASQQELVATSRADKATAASQAVSPLVGELTCRAQLIRIPLGPDDDIIGFDLSVEAVETPGQPAGLVLQGTAARALFWSGLGCGAVALLVTGAQDEDAARVAGGIGLTFLLVCDVGDFVAGSSPRLLPTLERFEVRGLNYRFVAMPAEGATPARSVHQFSLDAVISLRFDGTLAGLVSALAGRGIDTADEFGRLFAKNASEIEINGPLELGISNLVFGWETTETGTGFVTTVDERVRRVAGQDDLRISLRKVPALGLKASADSTSSSIPKPIAKADFVTKETGGGTHYGVSLRISGLENPDFKAETPFVVGLVLYFSPEFRLELEASLIAEPRFRFVIPHWVLVDGTLQLDKEIPGFDGAQNRISVDLGVINNKVGKAQELTGENLRLLNDISNYDLQFSGEVAWGEAFQSDPVRRLEFLFIQGNFEGPSPLFAIGPVGIYGIGGLGGRNIAPGMPGDSRDAAAIAQWIGGGGDGFRNVLDWPDSPAQDTWHPAKNFADDEPLLIAGLRVRAGPVGPRTVDVDALVLLGFDELWIAAAADVKVAAAKLDVRAIVVYDDPSRSFTVRARFEFAVTSGNDEILGVAGPLEISSGSGGFRISLGHYLAERGGPLVASLLQDLLSALVYFAYDSEGQEHFGFALPGMDVRPDLGRAAYSHGLMFQYGPKRIGPSAVNIRVHAAAGYNIGLSGDPFILVGELFLSGSLRVKVLFIKVGFTLTAALAGRLTSQRFDFRGALTLKIGMPWPISDVEVSVALDFTLGSGPAVPEPALRAAAYALTHSEPRAEELPGGEIPVLPIDAVIGLRFNRPITAIIQGAATATELPDIDPVNQVDPAQPTSNPFRETVATTLDGKDYTIEYEHYLSNVRVSHRPVGGGPEVVVPSMFASWEVPVAHDGGTGAPDGSAQPHHALYLNSLLQPGLDFAPQKLGKYIRAQLGSGVMPPCRQPERACLIAGSAPDITEDEGTGLRVARRASPHGSISVREVSLPQQPSPITLPNLARLGWAGSALRLPGEARIEVPPARRVSAEVELRTIASRAAGTVLLTLDVELAGAAEPLRLLMTIDFDPSAPCALGLRTRVLPSASPQVSLDATVQACATRGVLVLALDVAARQPGVRLRRMTLRGPRLIPPGTGQDAGTVAPDPGGWLKLSRELGEGPALFLNELCCETVGATHGAWSTVTQAFGTGPATDASVGQFTDALLLQPNREYTVTYRVQSYGRTATDADGSGSINDEAAFTQDSALTGDLRSVRFRTDAEPSQDIGRYIGFAYPGPNLAPVYPDQTVPLVSYRNNGLIKRIYEIHRGADALQSKIRDLDGSELETAATGTLSISSSAAGEVMEGLIGQCLDAAQGFTWLQVDMFERALRTDTRYGLSVADSTAAPGANDLPPYRSAFRTSRHRSFTDHVAAVNALLADPVQVPLLDGSPSHLLAEVFSDVASGDLAGHDDLVEALYRRGLAHETGRLAAEFGGSGDVAAHLVAPLPDGSLGTLGMALELTEPLIGKDGVNLGGMELPLPTALQGKGIALHQVGATRLATVRDRSGSRVILFQTPDLVTFSAMLAPVDLPVSFDGAEAVRDAVRDYVDRAYAALDDGGRAVRVDAAMTELAAKPELAGGLATVAASLLLDPTGGP